MFGARQREEEDDEKQRRRRRTKKRERVSRQKDVLYRTTYRGESKIGTPPPESSLVPSFDCVLRDEDYSVVDVNDDTQTTTTT